MVWYNTISAKNRQFYPRICYYPSIMSLQMEEASGERHPDYSSDAPTQMIPGKSCSDLSYRGIRVDWRCIWLSFCILLVGEPMVSLPVGWNLSGIEKPQAPGRSNEKSVEGRPIVQDPLGSSIMDAAVVHQQLMTDTHPQCLGQKIPEDQAHWSSHADCTHKSGLFWSDWLTLCNLSKDTQI